jgi:hypothetical protein
MPACVAGIHADIPQKPGVDGRDKAGHDGELRFNQVCP